MSEFDALRQLSARVGANPLLVQGPGGNTSLKHDGAMWIKASGTWLSQATEKDIFVPLDEAALGKALAKNDPRCEACTDFVITAKNLSGLRPSIETSVHGLMRQKVVVHVHCVSTIAHAIRRDGEALCAEKLKGLAFAYIPYARPGLQLAKAIASRITPKTSVLVLGNHGLAVAGGTVAEASALLDEVTGRLTLAPRDIGAPDLEQLERRAAGTDYRLPDDPACHAAALDSVCVLHGLDDVYYPDHAVFLGSRIPLLAATKAAALAFPGFGVLVRKDAKPAVEPMLRCLGDVFRRVEEGAELAALATDQVGALLNWDAEKYRQALKT